MGNYDWLFYEFEKEETPANWLLPRFQAYFRGDKHIKGSQIYIPYRAFIKPGVVSNEPHFHRDEQYLAFVGHDLRDAFESFDAEIEMWLGETLDDMEKIVINAPTMVRVPQYYWHGPIEIKRLGKPLFFQPVLFNGRYYHVTRETGEKGEDKFMAYCEGLSPNMPKIGEKQFKPQEKDGANGKKYDHLVHVFQKQYNYWGDFIPPYQAYFRGHDCMPDSSFYSSYRCYIKEAFIDKEPNSHSEEEYLCFTGYDVLDPWDSFDAEMEFWIGESLNKLEKHIITKPTIVRIPPFMWHCPLEYKKVNKPVYLQVLGTRGKFGAFFIKFDENGGYHLEYVGTAGAKKCVYEPEKQCTFCGKCFRTRKRDGEPANATESALRYKNIEL